MSRRRSLVSPPAFALAIWASTLSAAAHAQSGDGISIAVVTVGVDTPSQGQAIQIAHLARQGYTRNPGYAVLDLEAVLNQGAGDVARERLARAEAALERGQAAYDAFELDPALEALAEAIVTYEQSVGVLADTGPLMDAFRFQGAAFALKGDTKNALRSFERALRLDVGAGLEGGQFPDTVVALFEEARANVEQAKTGSVTIYASPTAAEVWIDGGFRGSSPITVESLPEGRHYVRVVRDGYVSFGETVDVVRDTEESVQATLRPTTQLPEYEALKEALKGDNPRAAGELAAFLKVDQLFWAVVESTGDDVKVAATLTDGVTGGALAQTEKSFVTTSPQYRAQVETWMAKEFRKVGTAAPPETDGHRPARTDFTPTAPVEPPTPGVLIAGYVVTPLAGVPFTLASAGGVVTLFLYDTYRLQGRTTAQLLEALGLDKDIEYQGLQVQPQVLTQQGQVLQALYGAFAIASDVLLVVSGVTLVSGITMIVIGLNQEAEIEDVLAQDERAAPRAPRLVGLWERSYGE